MENRVNGIRVWGRGEGGGEGPSPEEEEINNQLIDCISLDVSFYLVFYGSI